MEDFNSDMKNVDLRDFCKLYNLKVLIKVPTCLGNPINPKCIDLMFINSSRSFSKLLCHGDGLVGFSKDDFVTVIKEVLYLRWNEDHLSPYFGTLMTQL